MSDWDVEVTDEFSGWYESLTQSDSESVDAAIDRLIEMGPALGRPTADTLKGSVLANLKELRPTRTIRVFFAFDPRHIAILLIGGDKRGNDQFYEEMIPVAERLYDEYIETLKGEGVLLSQEKS